METLTTAQKELYQYLVEHIQDTKHAPTIRQMMRAMKLKSPAPIQSRLERLRSKGYIDWLEGQARTIRILHADELNSLPVLGAIAAGGVIENFTDIEDKLNLQQLLPQANHYVLKVVGDSMIEDLIADGDLAIMRIVPPDELIKNGEIVAARVHGQGSTLKHFYQEQNQVTLKASNSKYLPIRLPAEQVEIQGILVGVWRGYI